MLKLGPSTLIVVGAALVVPTDASAYVGPGAGLTVIGAAVALVAAVFLAIVGFIWYPIKRLFRTRSPQGAEAANSDW